MIDLKNYLNPAPSTLTIAPTYRCTAQPARNVVLDVLQR
jgi:hypothetical protein